MRSILLITCLGLVLTLAPQALARTSDRVLLVINGQSQISREIGDYYVAKRGIKHILAIKAPTEEEISREVYEKSIKLPLAQYLTQNHLQDEILYIVTTKGMPLKIQGSRGRTTERASVDSELTLLYREMIYGPYQRKGRIRNPYFGSGQPFDHKTYDIYLVTRLTGYEPSDVKAIIDRALPGRPQGSKGNFLFDLSSDDYKPGNNWLREAGRRLKNKGFSASVETSPKFLTGQKALMGYASWGSNDDNYPGRELSLSFLPGALAVTFVSTDGRSFEKPPDDWKPGSSFAGSRQSLIADLLHQGATGSAGHVYEPYLDGVVRPDILFPAYVSGFNLAESMYMAIPYLSWQTVVVGDPLAAPFSPRAEAGAIPTSPSGPGYFDERRQFYTTLLNGPPSAKGHFLLARIYWFQGFFTRAQGELEKALSLDAKFEPAYYDLAGLFMANGARDKTQETYLRLIQNRPDSALALNNLAWLYAQEGKNLSRAKELAEKAVSLKPKESTSRDTLGWVYLKTEMIEPALQELSQAVATSPNNPVYRYHLGLAYLKKAEKFYPEGLVPKDHSEGLVLKEKALAEMKKALELSSIFPQAEEARQAIQNLTQPSQGKIRLRP